MSPSPLPGPAAPAGHPLARALLALSLLAWSWAGAAQPSDAGLAAAEAAPPQNLRVTYLNRSVGSDGVQRETLYTDRLYRRAGMVWIEREMPRSAPARHEEAPGPHAGHAHEEARGAPLRITRTPEGTDRVEVILARQARVIEVERAHHGNVGYGGSWDAVYWLIRPADLQRMQRTGAARGGVQRYERTRGGSVLRVDWDVAGQYARRIERSDSRGSSLYRLTATPLPMPARAPWAASQGYARGDYSDLLD